MSPSPKPIIIISGPTASGKTSTSIRVAQYIQEKLNKTAAIINFDSLLFYKELSIGTAKPTEIEKQGIEHHMIDIRSITAPLNAADYCKAVIPLISKLQSEKKVIILVGGSGFYLRALIKGMYDSPKIDPLLQENIQLEYVQKGIGFIRDFLETYDLQSFKNLHENDHYRNIRAYEYYKSQNSPLSLEKEKINKQKPYDFSLTKFPDWNILHFYLDIERGLHQEIIKERTEQMIRDGLIKEVQETLRKPEVTGEEKPLSSIGYKETLQYIQGDFDSLVDFTERIIISTRQLAKSQRTFFKKITPKININSLKDQEKVLKELDSFLQELYFPHTD